MTFVHAVTSSPVMRRAVLLAPAMLVIGVFFIGGLAQALAQSLGQQPLLGDSRWSFDAYRSAATDPAVRSSIGLTLRIGILSTLLATVLGVGCALVVRRLGSGRVWMTRLFQGTLAVPHLVGALCISLLLSPTGQVSRVAHAIGLVDGSQQFPALVQDGFGWGIIAEYVWKETPFMAVIALAAMTADLNRLEDVSRTLGAARWQRLRHVTLPMLDAPVGAAAILVLAFTMGSYEVPVLLGRPFPAPLSVVTYQSFSDTDLTSRPQAMAVAVLLATLTTIIAGLYLMLVQLSRRRRT
ncbi:sugar ABC transporter permease [Aeromicrobium sp.]|uniref:ABC transporter permease n=1 Tax=Aeromicrobium sp. TaxID=1871063 RepID=UPI0030C5838A